MDRNRLKRQIREAMRTQAPLLGSYDYNVVIPGSKKLARPYIQQLAACLRQELKNALAR